MLEIHGLNAVYLKNSNKWVRLDARGNKPGVNAEFSIEVEKLAWPVRKELGEIDDPIIYAAPIEEVIAVLRGSRDRSKLVIHWVGMVKPV